jgi:hypothetical protein
MKRFLIAAALALASFGATAQNATITLTPEQAAQLAKSTGPAGEVKNISATVREEASAWGEMGANMGRAMVGAAKEVGVAANEFASTPLGKVTVAIVVYKLIGQDVISVIVGGSILVVGLGFALFFFRSKTLFAESVEYADVPVLWGAFNRKTVVKAKHHSDWWVGRALLGLMSIVLALVVGLNIIF